MEKTRHKPCINYIYCHGYYSLFSSVPRRESTVAYRPKFFTRCSICSYKLLCRRSNIPPYFCKHSRVPQTKPLYFARAFGNYIRLCPLLWRTGKNTRRVIGRISRLAFVKNHPWNKGLFLGMAHPLSPRYYYYDSLVYDTAIGFLCPRNLPC